MKNKKQILTILLSVLLPVFLVSLVVYATTIGNDISVGNDVSVGNVLTVTGTSTLTGALIANGSVTLGDAAADTITITGTPTFAATTTFSKQISTTKLSIGNAASTAGALKIHTHLMAAITDDSYNQYANEFKGEFLAATGTMDGISAHYRMQGSGTGVMRSIIGVAYLDGTSTLSGTEGTGSWISGILGSADVVSGSIVNGTAVTVTGVYGGLGSMGGTLTKVNDMSAMWADSQSTKAPSAGDSQLLLMTNSGTGGTVGTLGQAIKIDAGSKITNFVKFDNAGAMISAGYATGTPKKIQIDVDGVTYYINIYPTP